MRLLLHHWALLRSLVSGDSGPWASCSFGSIKHFWRYELMKLHIMRVARAVHRYLMAIYSWWSYVCDFWAKGDFHLDFNLRRSEPLVWYDLPTDAISWSSTEISGLKVSQYIPDFTVHEAIIWLKRWGVGWPCVFFFQVSRYFREH